MLNLTQNIVKFSVFLVVFIFLAGCSDEPDFNNIKNEEQLSDLINELKSEAQLDNALIKKCGDNCEGKTVFAQLVEPTISRTRFVGDSEQSKTLKANGIEFKPLNAEFNDDGITVMLFFKEIKLSNNEIKISDFEISGNFVENHYMNDDVVGHIVSVNINEEKRAALIAEQVRIEEHKALVERRQMEAKLKREKLVALLDNLSDGELKFYGANHQDSTVSVSEAEALCSMSQSVPRQALVTNTLTASQAIRHIANNNGSVTKSRIFWAEGSNECLVGYRVSGVYNGTNYSEDRVGKAVVFIKKASSYSIKYIQ